MDNIGETMMGMLLGSGGLIGGINTKSGAVAYVPYSRFSINYGSGGLKDHSDWTEVPGSRANAFAVGAAGLIYPQPVISTGNVYWTTPVALVGGDQWCEVELVQAWDDSAAIIGPTVRQSDSAVTFYGVGMESDQWKLVKYSAGSETVLASGGALAVTGDLWRVEAEGTTIRAYRNGGLVASETDSDIANGTLGLWAQSIGANNAIYSIGGGNLPIGNLAIYDDYVGNQFDARHIGADCGWVSPSNLDNAYVNVSAQHNVDHTHYFEWDVGHLFVPSKFRSYAPLHEASDWSNITVKAKVESGDAWTTVATGLSTSPTGVDGWREVATFSTIMVARYIRVEIGATAEADNLIYCEEFQVFGTTAP